MLKAIAMLGVMGALGGGTYVAMHCTDCGTSAADAAPAQVVSTEPCTACCPAEGAAATETVAAPCPAEGQAQDSANVTASATPAPTEGAAPQANQ
jgi:hypothetical protein